MKVIIVEGTDNTGKDTIINRLRSLCNRTLIIHCNKPKMTRPEAQAFEQNALFKKYVDNIVDETYDDDICDMLIFNRAWYGEYVYGTMYRERDKRDVMSMIHTLEKRLNDFDDTHSIEIYYVQIVCDSSALLKKNDDGLSISHDVENFIHENELFKEIFDASTLKNKKLIHVNDGDEFRDRDVIFNEVYEFIGK